MKTLKIKKFALVDDSSRIIIKKNVILVTWMTMQKTKIERFVVVDDL